MKYLTLLLIGSLSSSATAISLKTSKIVESKDDFNGWHASMEKFPGTVNDNGNYLGSYQREIPENYQSNAAEAEYYPQDTFTKSLLEKYATEEKFMDKEGVAQRTNHFVLTKDSAKDVARDILASHFSLKGKGADDFLTREFDESFNYFDVNREGKIDAVGSAGFFKSLTQSLGDLDLE